MIAKHSAEESKQGEGVEVVENCPIDDPDHGMGQYTEKRIHLSNRLPTWIRSLVPRIFYITEKAWNYYPFTITEYTCSFVPRFSINIQTKYLNDKGTTDNVSRNHLPTYLGYSLLSFSVFRTACSADRKLKRRICRHRQ